MVLIQVGGKAKDTRKYHFCPFPRCLKALKKLSQHIQQIHPEVSDSERSDLTKSAEVAAGKWARKPTPQPLGQTNIKSFFTDEDHEEIPITETPPSTQANSQKGDAAKDRRAGLSTCTKTSHTTETLPSDSVFPLSHPFLMGLKQHLVSRHGKGRSEREALQICCEVSKFLHFANNDVLDEQVLLDLPTIDRYLQSLEGAVQAATQNSKLNRIKQAITFLSLTLDTDTLPKVERVMAFIRNWASVLGKVARQTNRERLEVLSEQPVSFGDIDELVKCQALHQQLRDAAEMAKRGTPVSG